MTPDVLVIGDGIIGLSVAAALARRSVRVRILGGRQFGAASRAAAGLLAPSLGRTPPEVLPFLDDCRDAYPEFATWLSARSGVEISVNREGLLEVALDAEQLAALRAAPGKGTVLTPAALAAFEPSLAHATGAILHPNDGCVDNVRVVDALEIVVRQDDRIEVQDATVTRVELGGTGVVAVTTDRTRHTAATVVLAAGAWCSRIGGLPRSVPIVPMRGQMIAIGSSPLSHAVSGPSVYLVPRPHRTLVGATVEEVGFDTRTTPGALAELRAAATRLCGALAGQPVLSEWAGLRPVTPDFLPILGRDPEYAALLYACGHSKNGILMAPLTAECVADLVSGAPPRNDLAPFSVERFHQSRR